MKTFYVEIEKQDPAAAGKMMLEHFTLMELRGTAVATSCLAASEDSK